MPHPAGCLLTGLVFASFVAAGCSADTETAPPSTTGEASTSTTATSTSTTQPATTTTTTGSMTTSSTTTTTTTTLPAGPGPTQAVLDALDLQLVPVATADVPIDMAVDPMSGRVVLAQRAGAIVEFDGGVVGDTVLDLSADVSVEGEGGLLSIAFDPAGEYLYASFTDAAGDSRVVAFETDAGMPDPNRGHVIFEHEQPDILHNAGHIRFGLDGYLYLALGDGGPANDPEDRGQRLDTLLGKLLRIDPTPGGSEPYSIPSDNPFVDVEGAEPEIWAYGLRNPWRFAFDPVNGDLWIADVGQYVVEEVNWVKGATGGAGANFGWDRFEGPIRRGPEPEDHVESVLFYNHDSGRCSIIGGFVYRGTAIPDLVGAYLFSDYCDGRIRALTLENGEVVAERDLGLTVPLVVSMAEGPDREIHVFSLAGDVQVIAPA